MGSWSNGTPAIAPVVPYAVEELGTNLVPQEVYPPHEALFCDKRIFANAPQFHWYDYRQGALAVDWDAKNQIMELTDHPH